MSNPQTLPPPKRPRPRLESLSDLIYGLSLSLGAINLVISNQANKTSDINRNILEFVFVFLILITSWIIYTSDMSVLPIETRLVTFLNVILLVLVAIIPYLFDQVVSIYNSTDVQDYASMLFTVDLAASLLIMSAFAHIIASEESHLVDGPIMIRFRTSRNIFVGLSILVAASLLTPWSWTLLDVHVRIWFWLVPNALFWINRMRRKGLGIVGGIPKT